MLKIGIECESIEDQTWGVGRFVTKLLEELTNRPELASEFKFFLYFKSKIPDIAFLKNPIFQKEIIRQPFPHKSFVLYYYIFLPIRLWFAGLDVVFFPNYMLPIIFKGKSLVTLTEDVYYEFNSGTLPFRYKLAYRVFAYWAANHATKIMAISENSKKEVIKLFKINPDRIFVNQLGIDKSALPTKTQGLKPKTYILYVGQVFPRRHLKETILAFEIIASNFPDLKFIAIGKDKYNPPIIGDLVKEVNKKFGSERIIHKDYVSEEELADLYANAECLIYISSKEAFGLPPLEALAYGTPAVVVLDGITKEEFGDNAFFVENPDDYESIAITITDALTNHEKRQKIINSANQILQKYTWRGFADRFLDIVRKIAN